MYQAETLPAWIRGFVIGSYQLAITIGLLLASLVNYGTQNRNDSGSYRIPLGIQFAWSIILCGGLFFLPETPRFLVKKGKDAQAMRSLVTLRRLPIDHPALISEFEEIQGNWEYERSLGKASYIDCFRGNVGKRTITGITLQSLQQLVGVNFIVCVTIGNGDYVRPPLTRPYFLSSTTEPATSPAAHRPAFRTPLSFK